MLTCTTGVFDLDRPPIVLPSCQLYVAQYLSVASAEGFVGLVWHLRNNTRRGIEVAWDCGRSLELSGYQKCSGSVFEGAENSVVRGSCGYQERALVDLMYRIRQFTWTPVSVRLPSGGHLFPNLVASFKGLPSHSENVALMVRIMRWVRCFA